MPTQHRSLSGRVYLRADNNSQLAGSISADAANGPTATPRVRANTTTTNQEPTMSLPTPTQITINHPQADLISILTGTGTYAGKNTSELAFFKNDTWVLDTITEFADYAEEPAGDTRIYLWVPNTLIADFLNKYRADNNATKQAKREADLLNQLASDVAQAARIASETNLTAASHDLFMRYAQDAQNWGGEPWVSEGNIQPTKWERGNLVDLQKKNLITINKIDGMAYINFTDAGRAYALRFGTTI